VIGLRRYPDKPRGKAQLPTLSYLEGVGGYVCQVKHDGWRVTVSLLGGEFVSLTSRTGNRLAVPPVLVPGLEALAKLYPDSETALDGELMTGAKAGEAGPRLYLWDVPVRCGQWLGKAMSYGARREALRLPGDPRVLAPQEVTEDFLGFFRSQRGVAEGVVCKRLDSFLVGSPKRSAINQAWTKLRHDQIRED
jgi:ATP-dependent DNA ligase